MNQDIIEKQQVRGSSASIAQYAGKEGQIVFNRDNKRLHVMSGTAGQSTQYLSTAQAATKTQLSAKLDTSTYNSQKANFATKSQIPDTSALATKAEVTSGLASKVNTSTYTADKATFALKTEIPDTSGLATKTQLSGYATTTALTQGLAGKANATHTHAISDVTNLQTTLNGKILKSGSRGVLAGYETQSNTSGASATVGYATGDYITHNASGQTSITVSVDGANISDLSTAGGVKILFIYNATSLTSLSVQGTNGITAVDWEGDGAPTLDGKNIVRLVFQLHDTTASVSVKQWT